MKLKAVHSQIFCNFSLLHKEPCWIQHDSPGNLLSDCDLLSAFASACGKNLSAAGCAHSGSESVYLSALSLLGLECHFSHWYFLLLRYSCRCPVQEQLQRFSLLTCSGINMMKRRLIADLFHAGAPCLYVAACGCGVKSHIPFSIRKNAVPAAPALPECGYGCCFGHSIPL